MRVLVIGGTGKVGRHVVDNLRAAGAEAVPAARGAGSGGLAVDMTDAAALGEAARGFDAAYLTTPLGPEETDVGLRAVDALRRAGVGKIVYLAIQNLEAMAEIPHFATKIPVKRAVLDGGRGVVVQPNFFFQNDLLFADAVRFGGLYPLPVGSAGVWSVDVADIGRAAANALLRDDWDGAAVPVCGPERLTGPDLAAHWSAALGRPVAYAGDAIEPFMAGLERAMPFLDDWMRHDMSTMMRVTQAMGCPATDADLAAARTVIGRAPRAHADFVREIVHSWQSSPADAQAMA